MYANAPKLNSDYVPSPVKTPDRGVFAGIADSEEPIPRPRPGQCDLPTYVDSQGRTLDPDGLDTLLDPKRYPGVADVRHRLLHCMCADCRAEVDLAGEYGSDLKEAPGEAIEARRETLRNYYRRRKVSVQHPTAYQIAMMDGANERLAMISARLDKLRIGRNARQIDCEAFWRLAAEHRNLHRGFAELPTRRDHDRLFSVNL